MSRQNGITNEVFFKQAQHPIKNWFTAGENEEKTVAYLMELQKKKDAAFARKARWGPALSGWSPTWPAGKSWKWLHHLLRTFSQPPLKGRISRKWPWWHRRVSTLFVAYTPWYFIQTYPYFVGWIESPLNHHYLNHHWITVHPNWLKHIYQELIPSHSIIIIKSKYII